ncbi:acetylcholine receptor subunit beta-like [Saccostrea echinata]|uniref:acetylcholine receptor subunit beta-like n=1 Tax=Saccostrea echinata TaxID=191078 RepID=UPI002A7F2C17|nr:acetylcholine receptor subunit beta-like [Saccostrea echinata]
MLWKVWFLSLLLGVECYTIAQETLLHQDLLNGYNRRIRPGADRTTPVNILASFTLVTLKEFSESDGKIAVVGAFGFSWIDERLAWNPVSYGNDLYSTKVYFEDIWVPKFVNLNPYDNLKRVGLDEMDCVLQDSGRVDFYPPDLYESTCDADVTYYPFDKQKCSLLYYIPGYYSDDINILAESSKFHMDLYEKNGLWEVTETSFTIETTAKNFQVIHLTISMTRRTTYYIAGLLLPIVLMNFIQLFVFLLPVESGERLGFSITVLLAVAVFLTIIQDKLPEASEPNVSLLTYKLLVDMIIGCGMILAVVIGMRFYHRSDDIRVPWILRGFTRCFYLCCTQVNLKQSIKPDEVVEIKSEKPIMGSDEIHIKWNDVGKAFDRVCITFFFLSLVLNNIVYFIIIFS